MLTLTCLLALTAAPVRQSPDITSTWLGEVARGAGLTVESIMRVDLDGDGHNDLAVHFSRRLPGGSKGSKGIEDHHYYVEGSRGWNTWLFWSTADEYRLMGGDFTFCFPGSGSGQGCDSLEFNSGRPRLATRTSGNAHYSDSCDYLKNRCIHWERGGEAEPPLTTQGPINRSWKSRRDANEWGHWRRVGRIAELVSWLKARASELQAALGSRNALGSL